MSDTKLKLSATQQRILRAISDGGTWHLLDAPRGRWHLVRKDDQIRDADVHDYRDSLNHKTLIGLHRLGLLDYHDWTQGEPTATLGKVYASRDCKYNGVTPI